MKKSKNGFSLIELLVALSILSILSIVGFTSFTNSFRKARDSQRQTDLETVRSALEIYRSDNTTVGYPTTNAWATMTGTLTTTYLPDPPTDPHDPTTVYFYEGTANSYVVCALLEGAVVNSPCTVPGPPDPSCASDDCNYCVCDP